MLLNKNILSAIGTLALFAACSSAPRQTASIDDRTEYSTTVRQALFDYEKKESKVSNPSQLRAMLADTRAELNRMDTSSESDWRTHKMKVEDRMARLESNFGNKR